MDARPTTSTDAYLWKSERAGREGGRDIPTELKKQRHLMPTDPTATADLLGDCGCPVTP